MIQTESREGEERRLLPDTHAHLESPEFDDEHDAVIQRARAAGVNRILCVGSDYATSQAAVSLAHRYEGVYAAVGVHPHSAAAFDADKGKTRELLDQRKVVAVGEIGLDFHRGSAGRDVQIAAFREQVAWARERDMAVSVHNRGADEDVLEVMNGVPRGVLHCFSSSWDTARLALDEGHYISFAGNVTFRKADALREVAGLIPIDRLLVESDAPVLAPQPWRGRRNEPSYVTATARTLAESRGVTLDLLSAAISNNAARVFGWCGE
jgi:TatD DNase family protein